MKKAQKLFLTFLIMILGISLNPTLVKADDVTNVKDQANYEKKLKADFSAYLSSNKDIKKVSKDKKRSLSEAEKVILGEAIYRFGFDNRISWPENPVQSDGPYIKEFNQASEWFTTIPKERWSMPFVDNDGVTKSLNAYYIKNPSNSEKTVIVAHGYRMNALQMGAWAKVYYDKGYNILAPDARAHGLSEGNQISFGWKEKDDYKAWANKIVSENPNSKIVITGVSMGGATTMMTSGVDDMPSNVKAYVEDCGYSSVYDQFEFLVPIAREVLENNLGVTISDSDMNDILNIVNKFLVKNQGFSLKEASSVNQLRKAKAPMLFIHGGNDNFVPTDMVFNNFGAKEGTNKELWVVPNAAHGMSIVQDLPGYRTHVDDFLNEFVK